MSSKNESEISRYKCKYCGSEFASDEYDDECIHCWNKKRNGEKLVVQFEPGLVSSKKSKANNRQRGIISTFKPNKSKESNTKDYNKTVKKQDIRDYPDEYNLNLIEKVHKDSFRVKEDINVTYNDIITHFPSGMTPRPEQVTILKKIAQGIEDGYHYILLDAGTGIGKSAIAATLAEYFGSAYIVTVTKQLQEQYKEDFKFQVLKGRNNFQCSEAKNFNSNVSCDEGICQTTDIECDYGITRKGTTLCFKDSKNESWYFKSNDKPCPYWTQKGKSAQSAITLMNYASFFPEMNYLKHFGTRKLAVFDEAHNIENQVMNQISLTISNRKLKNDFEEHMDALTENGEIRAIPQISPDAYREDIYFWKDYLPKFIEDYELLLTINEINKKKENSFRRMVGMLKRIHQELSEHSQDWIIEAKESEKKVVFKPVEVSRFIEPYFFDHTDYSLLMSATILHKENFCRWHGIDPSDVLYIHEKSPFDVKKRPIYLNTAGSMAYKKIKFTKPKTISLLNEILDKHQSEKGIIHTHSHELTRYIVQNIKNSRILDYSYDGIFRPGQPTREQVIKKFEESSKPLVLVAPSVDEGVDFPDDLCRFQVIYKIPYPYLGDKQVATKLKRDNEWYAYQTVLSLIQAYGRGVRNKDDYCETYIIDEDIYSVLLDDWRKCKKYIPESFTEAINDPKGLIDRHR